jgi:hypothetical protein
MEGTMTEYRPQTAAETLRLIQDTEDPWVPFCQFLDDWRRLDVGERSALCADAPPAVDGEHVRWAALLAASVEALCAADRLPFPTWTGRPEYRLKEPWFLYPGWRLRAWQLATTPAPFKMRNIFGGDRILSRV